MITITRRKLILVAVLLVLLGGGFFLARVYSTQLSGAGPALRKPETDITKVLPPSGAPAGKAENHTGLPLQLADGFAISVYAKGLTGPRALGLDPKGRLVVSVPSAGALYAFDSAGEAAGSKITVISGLSKPHGFVFDCAASKCLLYIAETNAVKVFDYDSATAAATNGKKILDLPAGGNHITRTLHILTEGTQKRLLVSIGSSCNVCRETDERRAAIWQADLPGGTNFRPYATGLRNSVFITARPGTNELWATDMGRDLLGDNTPPDEINVLAEGENFGWPICYGQNVHDSSFDKNQYIRDPCADSVPAKVNLQAHSAPLGLTFLGDAWPEPYKGSLLVAYHGSWNRSVPTGYKIVRFTVGKDGVVSGPVDFLSGFLPAGSKTALGRPVDVLDAGTKDNPILYVSDDKAGAIYKITYLKP